MNKECRKCGKIKDTSLFSYDKYSKDGYVAYCKECWNSRVKNKKTMKRIPITKEDLQYLVDNWDSKTIEEISTKLGRQKHLVVGMVYTLRKLGIPLAKKVGGSGNRKTYLDFVESYKKKHG